VTGIPWFAVTAEQANKAITIHEPPAPHPQHSRSFSFFLLVTAPGESICQKRGVIRKVNSTFSVKRHADKELAFVP
jgi:hypothetical protein